MQNAREPVQRANGAGADADSDEEPEQEEYETLKIRARSEFDCESLVSTYSNTENHPALIAEPGRRPRRTPAEPAAPTEKIELSRKTGLPLGVLPTKPVRKQAQALQAPPAPAVNVGVARKRGETAEERAARKAAVKETKKSGRERKKALKLAFKVEEAAQLRVTKGQPVGLSVVHF